MFVTKKHIPRRTFLRGAGVTVALPLLESMLPALTPLRLTAAAPVKRFVGIWHPHGAAPGYWSPLQEGRDFEYVELSEEGHGSSDIEQKIRTFQILADYLERVL